MIEMAGMRCGKLVVVERASDHKKHRMWKCLCDCGNQKIAEGGGLRSGFIKSCGCAKKEWVSSGDARRSHGRFGASEYGTWNAMKSRCLNPKNQDYDRYGGRGITVCERWMVFVNFYADMGPRPSSAHTLDRRDNDGDYEPSNCRWATHQRQSNNRSSNRIVEYREAPLTLQDAIRLSNTDLSRECVRRRINDGWSAADALEMPRNSTYRGKIR